MSNEGNEIIKKIVNFFESDEFQPELLPEITAACEKLSTEFEYMASNEIAETLKPLFLSDCIDINFIVILLDEFLKEAKRDVIKTLLKLKTQDSGNMLRFMKFFCMEKDVIEEHKLETNKKKENGFIISSESEPEEIKNMYLTIKLLGNNVTQLRCIQEVEGEEILIEEYYFSIPFELTPADSIVRYLIRWQGVLFATDKKNILRQI